ncbi:PREDICTED: F-box only protein 32 [Thamnophis sirtalis]|uniref:F-box only protein 32 n=1 Tax=Thamnophis sirtalis TaxID=35019 RepID=A0A6I9XGQ1_9SAUR|nr:PREDICTED: F-box only protein 32 [Thamnophis sirtalis]
MPFLGQDWRSPGQNWVKTADGWTRFLDGKEHGGCDNERNSYCWKEEFNKENIFHNLNCDVAAKKRKKDQLNNKTRIQYFHQEKWIYVHKGSTKEVSTHYYFKQIIIFLENFPSLLSLFPSNAVDNMDYMPLTSDGDMGMSLFSHFPHQVLEDQQNIRLIKELLQTLYMSLCTLVQSVGKSVLVGNINMWVHRMEMILYWQQQLNNIQITKVSKGVRIFMTGRDMVTRSAGTDHPCTANNPESCLTALSPQDFINLFRF